MQKQKGNYMKKTILTLACAAIAPLAFAQTSTIKETTMTTETPLHSKTKTTTTTTSSEGTVTTFTPGETIVVNRVGVTDPISYVLGKTVEYVDRAGKTIEASLIKPGAKVHVYYDAEGDKQVVNRVVVDQ